MRFLFFLLGLCIASPAPASAKVTDARIGVAVPLSGSFARLGVQIADGVSVAADGEPDVTVIVADTECTAEAGAGAARQLIAQDVRIVIGFLCTEAIEAALPLFAEAAIPVITVAIRTVSLTEQRQRTGWPVFRLAPRADDERKAIADILTYRWREVFFAIVDDGTVYGRELAENLRATAEAQEQQPVFVDTFRPQLDNQIGLAGRLRRAGASHVFVGGDRSDIAILARDARAMDYDLTIVGGEALRAEDGQVPLPEGILMIGQPAFRSVTPPATLAAFAKSAVEPDGYTISAHAAAQIALQALRAPRNGKTQIATTLSEQMFDTVLGRIGFDDKGDLEQSFYRLFRYNGHTFEETK